MSGRRYSTVDSSTPAVRQPESSFNYWLQEGQVVPISLGELSPFNPPVYGLSSNQPAHPPVPHRPISFSSLPASGACIPFASHPTTLLSRTLSQGTLYQEASDDSTESSSTYLNSSNESLPSGETSISAPTNLPSSFRRTSYFGQSAIGADPRSTFPSANSSIVSNNHDQTGPIFAHENLSLPLPGQIEHDRSGVRQHLPLTPLSFPQVTWQPGMDIDTRNALVIPDYNGLQFNNTFAPTCSIHTQDLFSRKDSPSETTENVEHDSAKRRRLLNPPEISKRRTISRRHGNNGSRPHISPSATRNVLQGASQEDSFSVHIWHQVEGRPPRTARSTFGPERRQEVAQVRERGACFDCRFSKQRVRRTPTDIMRTLIIV